MNVVFYQLGEHLACELGRALDAHRPRVNADRCENLSQCLSHLDNSATDLIFCGQSGGLMTLLRAVSGRDVPVVVVSQNPEVRDWLDAMDAGAADYCAAPFEARHVSWILESNVRNPREAHVAATV